MPSVSCTSAYYPKQVSLPPPPPATTKKILYKALARSFTSPALLEPNTTLYIVCGHVHVKVSVHDVKNIRACANVHGRHKIVVIKSMRKQCNQAFLFPPRRLGTKLPKLLHKERRLGSETRLVHSWGPGRSPTLACFACSPVVSTLELPMIALLVPRGCNWAKVFSEGTHRQVVFHKPLLLDQTTCRPQGFLPSQH